jgi:hypothetical protein
MGSDSSGAGYGILNKATLSAIVYFEKTKTRQGAFKETSAVNYISGVVFLILATNAIPDNRSTPIPYVSSSPVHFSWIVIAKSFGKLFRVTLH